MITFREWQAENMKDPEFVRECLDQTEKEHMRLFRLYLAIKELITEYEAEIEQESD